MTENKQHSGANILWIYEAPKRKSLEKRLRNGQVKLFLDADLEPGLSGTFKHHIHSDPKVPWQVLRIWKKRGFRPLKRGIAHVRFEGIEKKYLFPAFFLNLNRKKVKP
jgi:hypothetical protein